MSTKKQEAAPKERRADYIATVREGAIAANIFLGQSQDGMEYHYFLLSRSWKSSKTEKEGYSDRFFAKNAEAIGKVAEAAARKCHELNGGLVRQAA